MKKSTTIAPRLLPFLLLAILLVPLARLSAAPPQGGEKGPPQSGQQVLPQSGQQTFDFQGTERGYWLHVPSGFDGKTPLPLVLVFHGAGGQGRGAVDDWTSTADKEHFLVVAPDGTPAFPKLSANFRTNPRLWNDASGRGAIGRLNIDDIGFVNRLLDDLLARYPIDPRRIYASGFSNGAGMTFRLGAELSKRLAAIAPVASHCWVAQPKPERAIPTIYLIGTADPLVPYDGGEVRSPWGGRETKPPVRDTLEKWAVALGCPSQPQTREDSGGVKVVQYGPGRDGSELVAYAIEGLGHHWPGSKGGLPESLVGKPSDKVDATDVIWKFFVQHPMPETTGK